MSGVWPHSFSFAFTSALASSSACTTAVLPAVAARCSGVTPVVLVRASTAAPAVEQRLHRLGVARSARQVERRVLPDAGHGAGVGAGVDQHRRQLGVAALGGPVQRAHAVALRAVDVGALLQQRAHGVAVAAHGRVGDRRVDGGAAPTSAVIAITAIEIQRSAEIACPVSVAAGRVPRR